MSKKNQMFRPTAVYPQYDSHYICIEMNEGKVNVGELDRPNDLPLRYLFLWWIFAQESRKKQVFF